MECATVFPGNNFFSLQLSPFLPKFAIRNHHISDNVVQSKDCQSGIVGVLGSNLKSAIYHLCKLKEVTGNLDLSLFIFCYVFCGGRVCGLVDMCRLDSSLWRSVPSIHHESPENPLRPPGVRRASLPLCQQSLCASDETKHSVCSQNSHRTRKRVMWGDTTLSSQNTGC